MSETAHHWSEHVGNARPAGVWVGGVTKSLGNLVMNLL